MRAVTAGPIPGQRGQGERPVRPHGEHLRMLVPQAGELVGERHRLVACDPGRSPWSRPATGPLTTRRAASGPGRRPLTPHPTGPVARRPAPGSPTTTSRPESGRPRPPVRVVWVAYSTADRRLSTSAANPSYVAESGMAPGGGKRDEQMITVAAGGVVALSTRVGAGRPRTGAPVRGAGSAARRRDPRRPPPAICRPSHPGR